MLETTKPGSSIAVEACHFAPVFCLDYCAFADFCRLNSAERNFLNIRFLSTIPETPCIVVDATGCLGHFGLLFQFLMTKTIFWKFFLIFFRLISVLVSVCFFFVSQLLRSSAAPLG